MKSHSTTDLIQSKRTGFPSKLGRRIRRLPVLLLLAGLWLGATTSAWSQVDTATLVGTVSDTSGAVVANAVVTVRDEATGLTLEQKVNGQGSYIFTALKIGTYTVTGEAPGFDRSEHAHVPLAIQQRMALNLTLKPCSVSETVEVSGSHDNLQTQDVSVGQVVTQDQINNLPLNGRNFTLLAQLSPGTTTTVYDSGHGEVQSGSFTSNGVVTTFNNYLLDGITNNNMSADFGNGNSFTLLPPPDALKEFKVENGNYSAEYGRSGGAVINAVTRSGQNSFFGDIWEYNRNAYFDAEDYFLKKQGCAGRNTTATSLAAASVDLSEFLTYTTVAIARSSSRTTPAPASFRGRPTHRRCRLRQNRIQISQTSQTNTALGLRPTFSAESTRTDRFLTQPPRATLEPVRWIQ